MRKPKPNPTKIKYNIYQLQNLRLMTILKALIRNNENTILKYITLKVNTGINYLQYARNTTSWVRHAVCYARVCMSART